MGPARPTLDTNTQGTASALHPQAFCDCPRWLPSAAVVARGTTYYFYMFPHDKPVDRHRRGGLRRDPGKQRCPVGSGDLDGRQELS